MTQALESNGPDRASDRPGKQQRSVRREGLSVTWQQVGHFGDIIGGISTALAFLGTLWLIRRESIDRRSDERARREERRDEEMRQARLVVASPGASGGFSRGGTRYESVGIRVYNYSAEPVFDLSLSQNDLPGKTTALKMLHPGEEGIAGFSELPDGWSKEHSTKSRSITVEFTDAGGRRWRRTDHGQPERVVRMSVGKDLSLQWAVETAEPDLPARE